MAGVSGPNDSGLSCATLKATTPEREHSVVIRYIVTRHSVKGIFAAPSVKNLWLARSAGVFSAGISLNRTTHAAAAKRTSSFAYSKIGAFAYTSERYPHC